MRASDHSLYRASEGNCELDARAAGAARVEQYRARPGRVGLGNGGGDFCKRDRDGAVVRRVGPVEGDLQARALERAEAGVPDKVGSGRHLEMSAYGSVRGEGD